MAHFLIAASNGGGKVDKNSQLWDREIFSVPIVLLFISTVEDHNLWHSTLPRALSIIFFNIALLREQTHLAF